MAKKASIDLAALLAGDVEITYGHADLVSMSDIEPRAVSWYWRKRIVKDDLNILAGPPGVGKSQIACAIVAEATARGESVIIMSAEDSAHHTLVPRLVAAGAVPRDPETGAELVHIWKQDSDWTIEDWEKLQDYIYAVDASLVIIDPIAAFVTARTDTYKDAHVRKLLAPLRAMAEDQSCTILALMHLKKGNEQEAIYNVGGSVAWTAAPRSVLLAKRERTIDVDRRLLLHAKCNVGPQQPTLEFTVMQVDYDVLGPYETSYVDWGAEVDMDAMDAFSPRSEDEGGRPRPALDRAIRFFKDALADGGVPTTELKKRANEAGISRNSYKEAFTLLDLVTTRPDGHNDVTSWPAATTK